MIDIISKTTTIEEAEEILRSHECRLGYMWEVILGGLLKECDYIEVRGSGKKAELFQMTND